MDSVNTAEKTQDQEVVDDKQPENTEAGDVVPGITIDAPTSPPQFVAPIPIPSLQETPPPKDPTPTITPPPTSDTPSNSTPKPSPFGRDDKTGMATMAGRRHKVVLAPGHSHMDWMRKTNSEPNLSGTGGRLLRVGRKELQKHNTKDDAWMVLRGKVYNITPYIAFHPGGVEELMKGAGRDGTKLFDHKHAWVNAESLLAKCLVGIFMPND